MPFDPQISKGVMACNLPTDGTPFGGYTGWVYFRCQPFKVDYETSEEQERWTQARRNSAELIEFASGYGITVTVIEDIIGGGQSLKTQGSVSSW